MNRGNSLNNTGRTANNKNFETFYNALKEQMKGKEKSISATTQPLATVALSSMSRYKYSCEKTDVSNSRLLIVSFDSSVSQRKDPVTPVSFVFCDLKRGESSGSLDTMLCSYLQEQLKEKEQSISSTTEPLATVALSHTEGYRSISRFTNHIVIVYNERFCLDMQDPKALFGHILNDRKNLTLFSSLLGSFTSSGSIEIDLYQYSPWSTPVSNSRFLSVSFDDRVSQLKDPVRLTSSDLKGGKFFFPLEKNVLTYRIDAQPKKKASHDFHIFLFVDLDRGARGRVEYIDLSHEKRMSRGG